jgi:hypothetical protein
MEADNDQQSNHLLIQAAQKKHGNNTREVTAWQNAMVTTLVKQLTTTLHQCDHTANNCSNCQHAKHARHQN